MTELEYRKIAFETILAKSIIANQYAINLNDQLKHTKFYKANVKLHGKPYNQALIKAEKTEFQKVDATDTKAVDAVFEQMDLVFNSIARCPFIDYVELILCIEALAKDNKSMVGIAKKVLS